MGIFDFFKKSDKEPEKIITQSSSPVINLTKNKEALVINLSKLGVKENEIKAKVHFCTDISGSMYDEYSNGTMQDVFEKILPVGLMFDDDGSVDVTAFESSARQLKKLTEHNLATYSGYVKQLVGGGTNYAPAIKSVIEQHESNNPQVPTFCVFLTDGENSDEKNSKEVLIEASKHNIFFCFIGIGNDSFKFLRELDDMKGRKFDNADFVSFKEIKKVSADEAYKNMLKEFIPLIKNGTL